MDTHIYPPSKPLEAVDGNKRLMETITHQGLPGASEIAEEMQIGGGDAFGQVPAVSRLPPIFTKHQESMGAGNNCQVMELSSVTGKQLSFFAYQCFWRDRHRPRLGFVGDLWIQTLSTVVT